VDFFGHATRPHDLLAALGEQCSWSNVSLRSARERFA